MLATFHSTVRPKGPLKVTFLEAKLLRSEEIDTEHLLLSILKNKDNPAAKILEQFNVDYQTYKDELEYVKQELDIDDRVDPFAQASDADEPYDEEDNPSKGYQQSRKSPTKSRTPVLDNFRSRHHQTG